MLSDPKFEVAMTLDQIARISVALDVMAQHEDLSVDPELVKLMDAAYYLARGIVEAIDTAAWKGVRLNDRA